MKRYLVMQTNVLLFLLGIQILKVTYANNYKITWHKNEDQNKKFLTVTLETNSITVTNIQKMNGKEIINIFFMGCYYD